MKRKHIFTAIICLLFYFKHVAQTASADAEKLEKKISAVQKQLDSIKKMIDDKDSSAKVCMLTLNKDSKIQLYKYVKGSYDSLRGLTVTIDSVYIISTNGYIIDIQLFEKGNNLAFDNGRAPIALTRERFKKKDFMGRIKGNNFEYILLRDVLRLNTRSSVVPKDDKFVLTTKENSHDLLQGLGIDNALDLRLYTDGLGVFGGQSNGLIQTEANFKHIIHRSNVWNRGIFLFNKFKFNLTGSKFDSRLAYTDSTHFSRSSLLQKSWLQSELALQAINIWLGKRSMDIFYVDLGTGLNISRVGYSYDTLSVICTNLFVEAGFDFSLSENFGAVISNRVTWNYSYQTDFDQHNGERLFLKPVASFFWFPAGNPSNKLFARVTYNISPSDKKNQFFQLQFGYSVKLSGLIKGEK